MNDALGAAPLPGAMPDRLPENAAAPDFDPRAAAKALLRTIRAGTLATIDRNTGHPFASLVNVATDVDGSPLILISRLATHTANLEKDRRASVLLASVGRGDPLAHPRLTVLGAFAPLGRDDPAEARARRRFLMRHPKSALYAGFADFSFWRLEVASAHLNARVRAGRRSCRSRRDRRHVRRRSADRCRSARGRAYERRPRRCRLALRKRAAWRRTGGAWRVTGLDPEGLDLALGDTTLRLPFPERVIDTGRLRAVLVELAVRARAG